MKLILSSCDFSAESSASFIKEHLPKPMSECRVLFFPNEKGLEMTIRPSKYVNRLVRYGFSKENVFVFDYSVPENFLGLDLDIVYISGGNTFGTLKRIRDAGFEEAIRDYVKAGAVYIGGSAGAHIASRDISHVEYYDDNNVGIKDYSGLGLYDGIFICHFSNDRARHYEMLKAEGKYKVTPLTDLDSVYVEK
ncbi:MAG: hypothetical protein E7675_04700 [Ruminococcaceae bacterium]|nr:hypothetical protein [Oscillospiraceae bacterium]